MVFDRLRGAVKGAGRRALMLAVATSLSTSAATTAPDVVMPVQSRPRPNVLLILVDDLKPALRNYGDRAAITPNLDRLARRGLRFEAAYANQAVCAPSRINLMTGLRSTSTGIYDFGRNLRDYLPDAVTLPQLFQAAGYHTESMGKVYHIGHGTRDDVQGWSVPHHREKLIEYRDPASTGGVPTREEALFEEVPTSGDKPFAYARTLAKGPAWEMPDVADDAYADGRIATRAVARLRALERERKPFFLSVGFARPHLPFAVPRRYWNLHDRARLPLASIEQLPEDAPAHAGKIGGEIEAYAQIPAGTPGAGYPVALKRTLVHGYYAGVSYVDAQIGKVLDELDRTGLARNTIVILWGDHGFHLGDHGLWTKHTNFEQATRIPLIFAGPGIAAGRATRQIAETVDIYPTLATLARLRPVRARQPIDGADLTPVLRDPDVRVRGFAYHSYPRGDWLGQAVRTDRYRLVRWTNERSGASSYELYDLRDDPRETRNVAGNLSVVRHRLDSILARQPKPKSIHTGPAG